MVHLYGMPAQMDELLAVARNYEIPVIEDAAEALGSEYKGKKAGTIGDLGVYSFNGNKIITTSGGGALVSANGKWIEHARKLATQARDPALHYQHSEVGFNYRLSSICAAIGRGQLMVLDQRVRARRTLFEAYRGALAGSEGFIFGDEMPNCRSNRWLTTMLAPSEAARNAIFAALDRENIESRPLWKPMHRQPVFQSFPAYHHSVAENAFDRGICLPSGSGLAPEEQGRVIAAIRASENPS